MGYSFYMPIPIQAETKTPDVEQGLAEESQCVCTSYECSYTAPCCRNFVTTYVTVSVLLCGGLALALFLLFLHLLNVF
jgi:hypothetical protein